ncbi:BsuPI-related putative proteinase inhibitor [Aquibacillus halophilus]|nr:BsuPI-related putative proteinase inhibitor [Aquibacillus halophilus]
MKKIILLLFILVTSVLLVGCGTSNNESNQDQQDENTSGSNDDGNEGIVAGKMVPSLTEQSPLVYEYQVANQTEQEITLKFTSSQRFDYTVETKDGEQLHQFSSVASFMQVLGEEQVKPGEALQYTIELQELNLTAGDYVLTAWMTPEDGKKYEVSTDFSVN